MEFLSWEDYDGGGCFWRTRSGGKPSRRAAERPECDGGFSPRWWVQGRTTGVGAKVAEKAEKGKAVRTAEAAAARSAGEAQRGRGGKTLPGRRIEN